MKKFLVNYLSDVAYAMYDSIADDKLEDVMFVGHYEDIIMVLKELLIFDETVPHHIRMTSEDLDGYDKEYCIILDNEMNIWCEPAYVVEEEGYLPLFADRLFIADDCNSILLKSIRYNKKDVFEVSYDLDDEECECDGNCECCRCSEEDDNHEVVTRVVVDKDGTIRGFEKSWSTHEDGMYYHNTYTHYSNNSDMLKQIMDVFNIKY